MKVAVATAERSAPREIPHTPWPLVQPPAYRVPIPTSSPATITSSQLASTCGIELLPAKRMTTGATIIPATNAARQPRSARPAVSRPPTIPLIPAIRPLNATSHTAAHPIITPPMSDSHGVK
ncbi:hypothetical protein WS65_13515 [Burkholderia anthina]|nr:hypothetical protein WS65_13515 [Burkholderia anthina]